MNNSLDRLIRSWKHRFFARRVPKVLNEQRELDRLGLGADPGTDRALEAAIGWLCCAQDHSASADGGVARAYGLTAGWQTSYPETTGYIIPTFLEYGALVGATDLRVRAQRMLDWLASIQLSCGAFQGGKMGSTPVVPVVFNTGQILMGLAAGEAAFGGYREVMRRAANWLVEVQDADGSWRKFESPFAATGKKSYDTHTAWGLLEVARVDPGHGYAEAALANISWALTRQHDNGWFDNCCLSDSSRPLSHTLGYALRGVLEGYRFTRDKALLKAARRTADGLMSALGEDGFLPGRFTSNWSAAASWACLTGTAQIAHCWLMLFQETSDPRYRQAAFAANRFVRRTMRIDAAPALRGVKGSFPVDGAYSQYEYPNWAAKFLIDSLLLEGRVREPSAELIQDAVRA